jgi:hypothetical protein
MSSAARPNLCALAVMRGRAPAAPRSRTIPSQGPRFSTSRRPGGSGGRGTVAKGRDTPLLSVTTGNDDHISIVVTNPQLSAPRIFIHFRSLQNGRIHFPCPGQSGVEVIDLEPDQHAMTTGRLLGIGEVRVIFVVPAVQLQDEPTVVEQALVDMIMVAWSQASQTQQLLIPKGTCSHITNGKERLCPNALPGARHPIVRFVKTGLRNRLPRHSCRHRFAASTDRRTEATGDAPSHPRRRDRSSRTRAIFRSL